MTDIKPPARVRIRPVVATTTPAPAPAPVGGLVVRSRSRGPIPAVDTTPREAVVPANHPLAALRVRVRVAPQTTQTQSRAETWAIPEGGRPLGILQKTHNGYVPKGNEAPDPRFRPLLIVMDPAWRRALPGYIRHRFEALLALTPEDASKLEAHVATGAYFYEWGLRQNLGYRSITDTVYTALRARLLELWDATEKAAIHPGNKAMMTRTDDGDLLVDLTKNSGPYYCDSLLGVEAHYAAKLTPLQRGA